MHDASKVVKSLVAEVASSGEGVSRVAVIGRAGAGKTTVALELGRALGIPVVHLDRLYWSAGWRPVPREAFEVAQATAIAAETWILDGGYLSSDGWAERVRQADLVVLVESPLLVCLWRIVRRPLRRQTERRPDLPDGCDEAFSWFFVRWTIGWGRRHRALLDEIEEVAPGRRVARLRGVQS